MILFLIVGMIVGAVALDFALLNMAPATVNLFVWQFTAPLSFVILGAVALGLTIAALAMLPTAVRESLDAFAYRREVKRQAAYEAANSTSAQVTA
ncbi:MAG: LapA family protein [Candidatus Pacebacteria bacterium]|nr:LapA family protein [Candidatus Paceibacterota bacterium]